MNSVRLVFTILPCLVGAYAAAVFLTTRSISARAAWGLGLLVASVLTVGAYVATKPMFNGVAPAASILESYCCLYFIPTIVLVATAVWLRSRNTSRNVGVTVIVALFLASSWIASFAASRFVGFVNVVQ